MPSPTAAEITSGGSAVDWARLSRVALHLAGRWTRIEQARRVNRKRGAWRRPQLAALVSRLEGELKSAYDRCEHGIALALAGEATQATQAVSPEEALKHHGLDEVDAEEPPRREALAAALILLGLFRAELLAAVNRAIDEAFNLGRTQLLARLKRAGAAPQPTTIALLPQMRTRFEGDVQRFYQDLLNGSKRSPEGAAEIAGGAGYETVGAQIAALRALFEGEEFRLSLLAEHATWWSWLAGFRAGAVDASIAARLLGEPLPRFEWRGPQDSKTCQPCRGMFVGPITVASLADLPDPSSVCAYGINCRHYFALL